MPQVRFLTWVLDFLLSAYPAFPRFEPRVSPTPPALARSMFEAVNLDYLTSANRCVLRVSPRRAARSALSGDFRFLIADLYYLISVRAWVSSYLCELCVLCDLCVSLLLLPDR